MQSQTFTSSAAEEGGRFYSDARPVENGTASTGTSFSISYNATTQSYTVTNSARTMTFAAADSVPSGSTDFFAYEKSSGTTHDSLSLTVPGSTGALQYQYVGGGAWEHVVNNSTTLDFSYNPFTYGIVTPDPSLQRTGTGLYSVSLVGARMSGLPYAMAGSGSMQVDFGAGQLSSSGVLTTLDVSTGYVLSLGIYYGSAALSSSTNDFGGTFAMDDGSRFTGSWKGRFYGPANQEVGAVWSISNAAGEYGAGYLIGRQDGTVTAYNTSLTPIVFSEDFAGRFSELGFHDNGNGTAATASTIVRSDSTLSYNASTGGYTYADSNAGINVAFGAGNLNAGASNSSVSVYDVTVGGTSYRLTMSKAGSSNPQIALTYTSYGRWQQYQTASVDARDRWFAFGVRTNAFQIPTGTAHFDGILVGSGATNNGGALYSLTGTSAFDIDFGAATFTGSLHPIGTNLSTLASRDFGSYAITGGLMDLDGGLAGNVVDGSANYLGFFEGALYGPQATEIGGSFGFQSSSSVTSTTVNLTGAVVGKR